MIQRDFLWTLMYSYYLVLHYHYLPKVIKFGHQVTGYSLALSFNIWGFLFMVVKPDLSP